MFFFYLEFGVENLMVSVGGYLGLFIGLSLNDVGGVIVDLLESMQKTFVMKKKMSF